MAASAHNPNWRPYAHWAAGARNRGDACALAAERLARAWMWFAPYGRGPHHIDAIGFVRRAVQCAHDAFAAGGKAPELADWTDYEIVDPATAREGGPDRLALQRVLRGWGLRCVPLRLARPGDVILFELPTVHLGVLIRHDLTDPAARLAHVMPPRPPMGGVMGPMRERAVCAYSLRHTRPGVPKAPAAPARSGPARVGPHVPPGAGPRTLTGASR